MSRKHTALVASLTFGALASACENHVDFASPEDHASHHIAFVGEDEALLEQLTADAEGFAVTPVFAAEGDELVSRVAFRFDAASAFSVQVRASTDFGETFGAWQEAEVTFAEDAAHNAHVDVPVGTTHGQLRFLAPVEAGLRFLAVEMFDFQPVAYEDAEGGIDSVDNGSEQGLAGDGIIVSRSSWGARSRNCGPAHSPNRITVHHTVSPNNDSMSMPARMRQIQAFHIDSRGYCDIGYHFLIGQDGRVYEGRPERVVGAHTLGDNTRNAGVSFIGTFTSVAPSEAQLNAGARIIRALGSSYGITLNRTFVKGHRQVGQTSTECPGNALYPRLQNLIDRATSGTGTPPPSDPTDPVPPPPSGFCAENGGRTGAWCRGDSVVTCDNGSQVSAVACSSGCQSMPAGTPDRCAAPPPTTPTTGFTDVAAGSVHATAIDKAVARGALAACGAGTFCPDRAITKLELAHALAVLETDAVNLSGVPAFNDVPSAFRASAREVVGRGIMQACSGGGFCSGEPVSRAAVSVYVRRAQGLTEANPSTPTFSDTPRSHWAYTAIERMNANGISAGCSTSPRNFCPTRNLTRAEAASFLANGWSL